MTRRRPDSLMGPAPSIGGRGLLRPGVAEPEAGSAGLLRGIRKVCWISKLNGTA